jgi:lipopolysaccharide/colanic/teichoic acid biosynthesis glycosyltransferase
MVINADKLREDLAHLNEREGVLFKISNDPRITKVGAILRKYSLDELPQLLNVLIGDMSLVGPRPPMAAEVEQYDIAHLRRLDVLPGMTGLWQVEARQDPSFDSYISLDTAYVENWNLLLDLRILARTIGVVVGGTGA